MLTSLDISSCQRDQSNLGLGLAYAFCINSALNSLYLGYNESENILAILEEALWKSILFGS
ncbi:5755_t:CDS:2 [Cetraspora pellucida]|uniref:5755_t:CDS:1 n=1 Tax=Cetraspora pellucida TaxID=1433469 RepID=A0ACA9LDM4_9GLOM|nr:5755_t:CDS:2 [Cetraspora pellucida]